MKMIHRVTVLIAALLCTVLLFVLFMQTAWYGAIKVSQKEYENGLRKSYVLVIDAGSSGTRMNAFTVVKKRTERHHGDKGTELPKLEIIPASRARDKIPKRSIEKRRAYERVETEPGLSTDLDIDKVALGPLLEWAKAVVPRSAWEDTPILLFGTAGMRRLGLHEQEKILRACRAVLAASGFWFKPEFARVIKGIDEGVYGWVAVNANEKKLGTKDTLGALDLGGSSLEVTYDVQDGKDHRDVIPVHIGGMKYSLYTHSIPHAGLDDAFQRSVSLLEPHETYETEIVKGKPVIQHPCIHGGFENAMQRIPLDGKQPRWNKVLVKGDPDDDRCDHLAEKVVKNMSHCNKDGARCFLNSKHPAFKGTFAALSGFYVVKHFYELVGKVSIEDVREATDAFCSLEWDTVQQKHKGEMAVETYCFRGEYVEALLLEGLGLEKDKILLGYQSPGWPMGAALVEGYAILQSRRWNSGSFRWAASEYMAILNEKKARLLTLVSITGILALAGYILFRILYEYTVLKGVFRRVAIMRHPSTTFRASRRPSSSQSDELLSTSLRHIPSGSHLEKGEGGYLSSIPSITAATGRFGSNGLSRSQTYSRKSSSLDMTQQ